MQNVINDVKESIELETEEEIVDEGREVVQALEKLREEVKNDAVLEYIPFLYPNESKSIPFYIPFFHHRQYRRFLISVRELTSQTPRHRNRPNNPNLEFRTRFLRF